MTKRKLSDPDYDIVKLHSKQKHSFLEGYLRVWTETVGGNKGAEAPTLQLFDLYAGTGACKEEYDGEIWDGSAVLMARALTEYPSRWRCSLYVNSFNEKGGQDQAHQLAQVTGRLNSTGLPRQDRPLTVVARSVGDAVADAAKSLDANFPSLWILDPWRPQQLPWEVVAQVASLRGAKFQRRPEMFITLMTYQLCQNIDNTPNIVSTALGLPVETWRPRIADLMRQGLNTREALVQLYGERLTEIYGREPWTIDVPGVEGNIVYVLFLCVERDSAFHSVRTILMPAYEKWKLEKFKPRAASLSANRGVDRAAEKSGHTQGRLF